LFFFQLAFGDPTIKPNGKVTIGTHVFNVEVAKSEKTKQVGLTKATGIKNDEGMLFAFDTYGLYGFWMKNMKFPVDIIFISDGQIVSTAQDAPLVIASNSSPVVYRPDGVADKILEINAGLVKKYNINAGDNVKIEL